MATDRWHSNSWCPRDPNEPRSVYDRDVRSGRSFVATVAVTKKTLRRAVSGLFLQVKGGGQGRARTADLPLFRSDITPADDARAEVRRWSASDHVSRWKGTLSSTLSSGCLRVRHRLGSSDDPTRHRTDAYTHDASHPESPAPILTAIHPEPPGTTLTDPWLDSGARPTPHERGRTVANDRIVRRWLSSLRHRWTAPAILEARSLGCLP
jgi:hypothetical protein